MKGVLVSQSKISSAYSKGLFLLLKERDKGFVEKIYSDFKIVIEAIGDISSDIYKKLNSPLITNKDKITITNNLFGGKIEKLLLDFITLVVEKGRFGYIYEIYEVCLLLKDQNDGVVRGEVRVAKVPDKKRQSDITESLTRIIGKKVLAEFVEDEAVIAGFTTMMGTYYVDYSLANHLVQMETELNRS